MKIIKNASGKQVIKMSKSEWQFMGEKAGWIKEAAGVDVLKQAEQLLSTATSSMAQFMTLTQQASNPKTKEWANAISVVNERVRAVLKDMSNSIGQANVQQQAATQQPQQQATPQQPSQQGAFTPEQQAAMRAQRAASPAWNRKPV